jgi:hypothetical protein
MAQFGRPDSDVSAGSWTATPLWSKIDEVSADDADFVTSSTGTSTCEAGLSNVADPAVSTGHVVRYRYQRGAGGSGTDVDLRVRLLQGTTQIGSWSHNNIGAGFTTAAQTLTGPQADAITDYSDLRLEFQRTGTSSRVADVSWAELDVPSATVTAAIVIDGLGRSDGAALAKAFGTLALNGVGRADASALAVAFGVLTLDGTGRSDGAAFAPAVGALAFEGIGALDAAGVRAVVAQTVVDAFGGFGVLAAAAAAVAAGRVAVADLAATGLATDLAGAGLAAVDQAANGIAIGDAPR